MATPTRAPRASVPRRVARTVANLPGAGLVFAPPRTARFAVGSWVRSHRPRRDRSEVPAPRASLGLTAQVALDEMMLGWMKSPRRFPASADYATVASELRRAASLYRRRGFIGNPASYHREPPPLQEPEVRSRWASGLRYEVLSWPSAYRPHQAEPGRARWEAYAANRTAHALVLRADPDRPWLICVHGFGTGMAVTEFFAFRARHLHEDLGLNLAFPVLPLHGPRRFTRMGGTELMSYQLQNFVLGMAQSVWDVRTLLRWLRGEGADRVGVYGMSLGAYVASLLVTLEDDLEMVIAGAPVTDVPKLFEHHSTATLRRRVDPDGTLGTVAREVHSVISPLVAPPRVPAERRYLFAGLGDRMAPPSQAQALWSHWEEPRTAWYEGSHLTFLWSTTVARFIDGALAESGLADTPSLNPRRRPRATRSRSGAGTNGSDPRRARS